MKKHRYKKLAAFITGPFVGYMFLLCFCLFFLEKCTKETSTTSSRNSDGVKPSNASGSSVIYKDVIPDSTLSLNGATYGLDINGDGIVDYKISNFCNYITFSCLGNNEVILDGSLRPQPLLVNTPISSSSAGWKDSVNLDLVSYTTRTGKCPCIGSHGGGCGTCIFYTPYSNWLNNTDAYIGLRIHKGNAVYYAWLRLTITFHSILPVGVTVCGKITTKDYAYNNAAGQSLLAGQTQ